MSATSPQVPPPKKGLFSAAKLFWLAVVGCVVTFLMLVIGGAVNPTGSSLACPNWEFTWGLVPMCKGEALPEMSGGVLYEHGHRLWGWLVGLATVGVCVWTLFSKRIAKGTKILSVVAVFVVGVQGLLGGLTVKLQLHWGVSTAHLVLSYLFLTLMIYLTWRLKPSRRETPQAGVTLPRTLIALTFGAILLQVFLGGAMRHVGAGMICGTDPVACGHLGFWPSLSLGKLHMTHRYVAYVVGALVIYMSFRVRAQALSVGQKRIATLALIPAAFVIVQIVLGLLTVMTGKSVPIVTAHTSVGALLLVSTAILYMALGPLGDDHSGRRDQSDGAKQPTDGLPTEGVTA